MKRVFIAALLLVFTIDASCQNPGSMSHTIDSLEKIVSKVDKKHRRYNHEILSSHGDNNEFEIDKNAHAIAAYKKNELVRVYYEDDMWGEGSARRTFYLSDSSLIYADDQYYSVKSMGGPTLYERTYYGKYYFLQNKLITQEVTGESRFTANEDVGNALLKELAFYKELLGKKRTPK